MKFGSPIAQAALSFTGGQYDLLTPNGINIAGAVGIVSGNQLVAKNVYRAIYFFIQYPNTTVPAIWASIANPAGNVNVGGFSGAFAAGFNSGLPGGVALSPMQALSVGCLNNPGDNIGWAVTFNGTVPANTLLWIYGITAPQPNMLIRPDGRNYPVGANIGNNSATNTTANIVAAPGAGNRLLIKTLYITSNGTNGGIGVTINGLNQFIVTTEEPGVFPLPIPPDGILCDPNTAITVASVAAGVTVSGSVVYDIVPA